MGKKSAAGHSRLSRRERQIMEIVYQLGEASVAEVRAAMADAPSRNSVRTLLGILEKKGHLRHRESGRKYIYRPTQPRAFAGASAVRRVVKTFFDGSIEQALAVYLSRPDTDVTDEELKSIESLIREARKKGR